MNNSLKGWSRIRRSGIWRFCSFEKIGARETTGCHLGNLVSFTDDCDLFFVWEVNIMSHLINEILCGTYQHLSGIGMCVLTCVTQHGLQEDFVFFAMVILLFICIGQDGWGRAEAAGVAGWDDDKHPIAGGSRGHRAQRAWETEAPGIIMIVMMVTHLHKRLSVY